MRRPARRWREPPGISGIGPCIQHRLMPFLSNNVRCPPPPPWDAFRLSRQGDDYCDSKPGERDRGPSARGTQDCGGGMGSLCEPLVCRTPRTARVPGGYRAHRVVKSQGEVEGIFLADRADVALPYCSGAPAVTREVPGLETVPLPLELTVGPAYGMVLLNAQALEGNQAKWRGPQHC